MKTVLKIILGLFVAFIAVALFAAMISDDDTSKTLDKEVVTVDSLQLAKDKAAELKADSIAAVEKEAAKKLLSSFKVNKDEFNNTAYYRDKRTPYYSNINFIYPYIGNENDRYWLRLKFQYAADDWLFIEKIMIKTDTKDYTLYGRFERDNNSDIWEWHDIAPDEGDIFMLRDIANSKKAMVRYQGSKYHADRTLTSKEKSIITKTLDIYDKLK